MNRSFIFVVLAILAVAFVSAQNCGCSKEEPCCSQYGYCGTTADYCDKSKGCRSGCWGDNPTSNLPPTPTSGTGNSTFAKKPKFVIYTDDAIQWGDWAKSFFVPGSAPSNAYNVINIAFWMSNGPSDMAQQWASLSDATRNQFIAAYHKAGIKVIISAFGAADAHPSKRDAAQVARELAAFAIKYKFDGVDIDYEDEESFSKGYGAQWVITLHKTLRSILPKSAIITHAPQGPHFATETFKDQSYVAINKAVGNTVDWYNVQFYNNGGYTTCQDLMFNRNGYGSKTSVLEIMNNLGIPSYKIVIGKPVGPKDADNGYMPASLIADCVRQGRQRGYNNGGVMGWELKSDRNGDWSRTVAAAFK
eukprot:TRINITY_DN6468_c0_g1_i1.p1 TRINITY_DN6468_c0_g1~~TRINITY_DN6468_c0_g1_i1.p1  ORF type:complete len:362 (-),score=107.75 TRINITY_DN6468_c0_g1_i1:137-1222(-)